MYNSLQRYTEKKKNQKVLLKVWKRKSLNVSDAISDTITAWIYPVAYTRSLNRWLAASNHPRRFSFVDTYPRARFEISRQILRYARVQVVQVEFTRDQCRVFMR